MDAWERQRSLARTTTAWAAASIAGGLVLATRSHPWWRAFGQQHVGWGAADLGIVAVAHRLQNRRMRRLPNPYAPAALERERRQLRTILLASVAADAAYVVGGAALWRVRRHDARAAGAGAAIVLQGLFLLWDDASHVRGL